MKPILLTALALGLGAGQTLQTDYTKERSLTVTVSSSSESKTTAMEMTLDGEPVERGGGGGGFMGGGSSAKRSYSFTDSVLATKDGAPTKVKRTFGEVGGSMTRPGRDGETETDLESAFTDAVVVIDASGDEVKVEVVDGKLDDEQTKGLSTTLLIDHLLHDGEVEAGEAWELSGEDVLAAFGLGLERQLYRRPAPEGGGQGRGGQGGRGQGRPGGMMGGGSELAMLADGDWDAKAKLTEETEEVDGVECAVIELAFEVSGEMPDRGFGGGRGRDRAFGLEGTPRANTYEAEFEGKLLWSIAEARPVQLHLTGKLETEMNSERESDRGVMSMHREQETTFELHVSVTAGPKGE